MLYFANPSLYAQQIDPRKMEYYPVTVVKKNEVEVCTVWGTGCNTRYEFKFERTDGTYDEVFVDKQLYDSTEQYATANIERHMSDPAVVQRLNLRVALVVISVLCLFSGLMLLIMSAAYNHIHGSTQTD